MRGVLAAAALLAAACFTAPVHAQQANATLGNSDAMPDPVLVFNRICYSNVPSVKAVEDMSLKLAWKSMDDADLDQFRSYENPAKLRGWDVQVGERLFRVGIIQAAAPDALKSRFAGFENGTATSCTVVLDDQQEAAAFMPDMQRLAGREPVSSDVPEGLLRTTTWAGGNDDIKVFLFAKAPATGKGGLLNVTILQK